MELFWKILGQIILDLMDLITLILLIILVVLIMNGDRR